MGQWSVSKVDFSYFKPDALNHNLTREDMWNKKHLANQQDYPKKKTPPTRHSPFQWFKIIIQMLV